ncbi:MAG: VOC family protein [Anaerolineae bacterium]|nr:VOC family protein [Anaerolineae bacterium]MCI0607764.1 VOC family protein [Anaerolineae bacterium]
MKLHELAYFTDNVKGMADFYRGLLGSEPVAQSDDMAIFMSGGTKIFIHRNYPPSEGDLPPNNHIAFAVEDVDAACAALTRQGLTLEIPPKDYYWGRSAYLRDPDGHQVEITKAM